MQGFIILFLGFIIFLSGCQAKHPSQASLDTLIPVTSSPPSKTPKVKPKVSPPKETPAHEKKAALVIIQEAKNEKDTLCQRPKNLPAAVSKEGNKIKLTLDMEGADLLDFLDLLFKETLKVNYAVDQGARAKITVHIHGSFTPREIMDMVAQVLALDNLALVKSSGLVRILPANKLATVPQEISFVLFRPRYLKVTEINNIVQALVTRGAKVLVDKSANILLVIDTPENVAKVSRIVTLLDEDVLSQMTLALYKPKVLEAETLANYLKSIFEASPWKDRRLNAFIDFIPLKEINSLLIVTREPEALKRVYRWINELDQGELAEKEVFIYQVENGDAEEIAQILQQTFSGSKLSSTSSRKTIIPAQKTQNKVFLAGDIRIIPDKSNNLLVIKATRQDYLTIKRLLQKIDVLPRQVVIEMLIMEITLNKELQHGVEWFLKNHITYQGDKYDLGASFSKYGISPDNLQNVGQTSLTGLTMALYRAKDLGALFNILQSVSQINILSSPVILATDNKEARIQIGQEVPIITQQVTNTSASQPNITSTVQYRDTGIILDVKPHINSSGLVKLDIVQEISSAQKNYLGLTNTPLITKRKIETSLVVKNNQTVILGGLIDNRQEFAETGVPLLKDIPVLGHFFKWQKKTRDRTELLVAITPRVVRNYQEAEAVMHAFKEKIRALRERLQQPKQR